jgi:hypothetical protein
MTMASEIQRPSRRRGKGFPALPLDESVSVIEKVGRYGRSHSLAAFAGYLGHQTTNSGPFQGKMAALNDWGLIDRRGDEVALTELAQHIAYPTSPDEQARMIRDAFFNAGLFATVYDESAKGVDLSLDLLGNRAVGALGVAPQRRDEFARTFVRSAVAAGLAQAGPNASVVLVGEPAGSQPARSQESPWTTAAPGSMAPEIPRRDPRSPDHELPTLHQEWSVQGGRLVFEARLDRALPAVAFGELASIAAAIERLVGVLGEPNERKDARSADEPAANEDRD